SDDTDWLVLSGGPPIAAEYSSQICKLPRKFRFSFSIGFREVSARICSKDNILCGFLQSNSLLIRVSVIAGMLQHAAESATGKLVPNSHVGAIRRRREGPNLGLIGAFSRARPKHNGAAFMAYPSLQKELHGGSPCV